MVAPAMRVFNCVGLPCPSLSSSLPAPLKFLPTELLLHIVRLAASFVGKPRGQRLYEPDLDSCGNSDEHV